ncbi:hypothetical protein FOZ60_000655 [Perkinsus olseni]|uniref:Cytochrome P450 n=1 Tax=Perkinsus olseni TaxID=32597 RepID=A0A7J6P2N0_PEROL|nr:hypothetical protein FOZ60_000655 [Perkinsus olseni]
MGDIAVPIVNNLLLMKEFILKGLRLLASRKAAAVISGVVLAVTLTYRATRRRNRLRERFSGPSRLSSPQFLPLLGYVPRSLDQFFTALEMYAETYGDIYCIKFMGMQVLVVSSPELVRQVLKERPNAYVRAFNKHNVIPIPGLLTMEGEIWKRNRRLCSPAFNEKNSDRDGATHIASDSKTDSPVGVPRFVPRMRLPPMTRNKFPWNLNPRIKNFYSSLEKLNKMWDEVTRERRAEREAGGEERFDLLDKLLHLTDEELKGNLTIFLAAGFETTAMTIAWCFYYLSLYPDVQAKARAEVDNLGHDPEDGEDLSKLPFVQPPGFFLLHECISKTTLAGEEIPPGTMVATLLHKAMICKEEGGTEFKPDRWILPNGEGIDTVRLRSHFAFGGGPRECPGKHLAIREGMMVVATILRHFDGIKANSDISKVHGRTRFVQAVEGLELKMNPRSV